MSDTKIFQYKLPYPVKATCVTDPLAQTTVQPTEPALNVLSESIFHPLLAHKADEIVRLIGIGFSLRYR